MSATLGNTAPIESRIRAFTRREVAHVHSDRRPVPLDFEYRETPLHETLQKLMERDLAPVYVVSFTQRDCGERAQALTSANLCQREQRKRIAQAIGDFRFDTAYGRDLKRFLSHGIGVHHAGLLPKYRLLVERLAQQGLLRVICGTDTLGVGVNVPIRTVLFTQLSKFDGEKVGILPVRDFKQIAGRAGRKGFDDRGAVVCQAPEHVIENRRLAAKAASGGGKRRPARRKRAPSGFVPWNEQTFEGLIERPPEMLRSRFDVSHGMILSLLQRDADTALGYRDVLTLVDRCHESDVAKSRMRRRAAQMFRALRAAGVVEVVPEMFGPPEVRVAENLQSDFSLHHTLSLWMLEANAALDADGDAYALEALSVVEAVQDDPRAILREQVWKRKRELMTKLKAEGVEYDERMRKLEEVTWDRPEEAFIRESFRIFAEKHPWVREHGVRPKSVAREMFEGYLGFDDYVAEYSLARGEGLLLRYLSQVHNTLVKSLPEERKTEALYEVIAFFRTLLAGVDSSLVEAWEELVHPVERVQRALPERPFDLAEHSRALAARVRSEMLSLVRALARGAFEAAPGLVRQDPDEPFDAEAFERALAPFLEEYGEICFTPDARRAHHTRITPTGPRNYDVTQVLVDPKGDDLWALHGEVDLTRERDPVGPLVRLRRIGT
jgi:superfamily II RNA helicase